MNWCCSTATPLRFIFMSEKILFNLDFYQRDGAYRRDLVEIGSVISYCYYILLPIFVKPCLWSKALRFGPGLALLGSNARALSQLIFSWQICDFFIIGEHSFFGGSLSSNEAATVPIVAFASLTANQFGVFIKLISSDSYCSAFSTSGFLIYFQLPKPIGSYFSYIFWLRESLVPFIIRSLLSVGGISV